MSFLLLFSFLFFALSGLVFMQRHLHMLQQNSYFPSRYFGWLKGSFTVPNLFCPLLFVVAFGLMYLNCGHFLLPISIVVFGFSCLTWHAAQKRAIKKLVYTARVKRLIAATAVLSALPLIFYCLLPGLYRLWGTVTLLFAYFPFLLMLTGFYCALPVEKAIANQYLKQAKQILAAHPDLKVLGVTGSFGKTTVKTVLARLLSEKYNVVATPGSFNTPMGIVRTVREHLRPETEIFIAEMGAKNVGDIAELCEICHPQSGIITAVGPQHLETFKTLENVANTKFELAQSCLTAGGSIYVNADSEPALNAAKKLPQGAKVITYGTAEGADCRVLSPVVHKNGCSFTLKYNGQEIQLVSRLLGKYNMVNIAGAAAMALDLGVTPKQLRFAVTRLEQTPHRLELKSFYNSSTLLDDAYNANPVGCLEAVRVLGSFNGMKKIIVTPGLVELGEAEYESNVALGKAAAEVCDTIILVGENRAVPLKAGAEQQNYPPEQLVVTKTLQEALDLLKDITTPNTVVLFENDLPDNYAG